MPLYTYRVKHDGAGCERCRENFDVLQKMDDERLKRCPDCGAEVQRIITGANLVSSRHYGDKLYSREKIKGTGLRKLVKDDSGNYVDDTPS
jgi:putative FmdB family regulatory protein